MEIIKFIDQNFELDVNVSPENETVWLNQDEIAMLFDKDRKTITWHINQIYKTGELQSKSTCSFFERVQNEGNRLIKKSLILIDPYVSIETLDFFINKHLNVTCIFTVLTKECPW